MVYLPEEIIAKLLVSEGSERRGCRGAALSIIDPSKVERSLLISQVFIVSTAAAMT